jgi:hypothetical protein
MRVVQDARRPGVAVGGHANPETAPVRAPDPELRRHYLALAARPGAGLALDAALPGGEHGLPQDGVAGAGLVLVAKKDLSLSDGELGADRPEALPDIGTFDIDDALRRCRQLIAETDPW